MNDVIDCIPSKDLKEYLSRHPIEMSVLQQATIVSEYASKKRKIELFQRLSEETATESEKTLLNVAIEEINKSGYTGKETNKAYALLFPHDGTPLFPFLEICDLPVLFGIGDIISYRRRRYYVAERPAITDNSDFSDECYLCYGLFKKIDSKEDLFCAHEHIGVCVAEASSFEDLTDNEAKTAETIKRLI
ncbi:MAG: hypothetical protein J5793_05640 [Clostridia bacterium]|nr:hypothetical protein [Clostridia bacterium]